MKKFTLLLLSIIALMHMVQAQTLKKATGGDGKYKDDIWWLDFSNVEIAAGANITQTYNIENKYTLVVMIDNVSFSGTLKDNVSITTQRIVGYKSGSYGGDGLVKLYNIGVTNNGQNISDRARNTLYNAVSMKYDGSYSGYPNEAKANFRVTAYAYLNNIQSDPIDVGLVFADAETDEPSTDPNWQYEEYSQGYTNGSPWQFLETGYYDPDGQQKVVISNNGYIARTICGFNGYNWNIGNSILMYTRKRNTTSQAPLVVDMEFKGGGNSATAIGFMLAGVDLGDAPSSYGKPENLMPITVIGGVPATDGTYYISSQGTFGGSPQIIVGALGYDNLPKLGTTPADPDSYGSISNDLANKDNEDGINDEDAITTPLNLTTRSSQFNISFNAYTAANQNAYINGWFDMNQNGQFDNNEFNTTTINNNATINFNWSNLALKTGTSYLRLRIQSNVAGLSNGSADMKMGGETEDYKVNITTFITGNVFRDANGLQGVRPNTVDGLPIQYAEQQQLYVSLLKGNSLVAQKIVATDGSYEFEGVEAGNYTVVLTTVPNGLTPTLPTDWVFTGENIGRSAGHDQSIDGKLNVVILVGGTEVNEVNFGIDKRPNSNNISVQLADVKPLDTLSIGIGNLPPLAGLDEEDGIYSSLTGATNAPTGIVITSLPVNGELYYQGNLVAVNDTFKNLAIGDLYLVLTGRRYKETSFKYAYLDAAGYADLSPAIYEMIWGYSLPVVWKEFNVTRTEKGISLDWTTVNEKDNIGFDVQKSVNGKDWETIGFVSGNLTIDFEAQYHFLDKSPSIGTNFYRLKQWDANHKFSFSTIAKIECLSSIQVDLWPNPCTNTVNLNGSKAKAEVFIYKSSGQLIKTTILASDHASLDVSQLPSDHYILIYQPQEGNASTMKFIKK